MELNVPTDLQTKLARDASWDSGHMPNATINVDATLKARLADLAGQSHMTT